MWGELACACVLKPEAMKVCVCLNVRLIVCVWFHVCVSVFAQGKKESR